MARVLTDIKIDINFKPMNTEFKEFIPKEFNDNSRVWIYQSERAFSQQEALAIIERLKEFSRQWLSHGSSVKSYANLFFDRFIILMADESEVAVGGCSTDASTRFIKQLGKEYSTDLFNRQSLAFIIGEHIESIPLEIVNQKIEKGLITGDTIYFNNTILTRKALLTNWIIPVKDSWLSSRIPKFTPIPKV